MDQIRLNFTPQASWACLREVSGAEEQAVAGTSTLDAIQLLDRLLMPIPGAVEPGGAAKLITSDRDRLLARIYIRSYGARIEATLGCRECGERFDIRFSLEPILASLDTIAAERQARLEDPDQADADETPMPLPDGSFRLAGGSRFRLPTGEDECAILGLAPEEAEAVLLARCLVADHEADREESPIDGEAIQEAMAALGPAISLDVDAWCSECGSYQAVPFDLQHYLLTALRQEQAQLALDIHWLASSYGWGLTEILGLSRSQRRRLVGLIEYQARRRTSL